MLWKDTMFEHMARVLNGSLTLDDALDVFLEASAQVLGLETGWIWLYDEVADTFELAAHRALPMSSSDCTWRCGQCYCQSQFTMGQLDRAQQIGVFRCSRLEPLDDVASNGLRHHVSVALDGHGILNLASARRRALAPSELQQLEVVRDLLVMAIERARHIKLNREQAVVQQRAHMAGQLHDTIAQNLAGVLMISEVLSESMDDDVQQRLLGRIVTLTRDSLADVRHMVTDWRAHPDLEAPLSEGLHQWLEQRLDGSLTWSLHVEDGHDLPLSTRRTLIRAIQEGVHNALYHANAKHLSVTICYVLGEVVVCVEDDGDGFDVAAGGRAQGVGMQGLQDRVMAIGGQALWICEPGEGTTLEVRLPVGSS